MTVAISPRADYHQIAAHARWELQRLADHNRADMDAFTEWAGEQDLWPEIAALFDQAQAELDATAAEMRAKYGYASDVPDGIIVVAVQITDERAEQIQRRFEAASKVKTPIDYPSPQFVPRRPDVVLGELYEQRVLAGPAVDDTLPGREALTPRSQVQAGPRWRPLRRLDDLFARADAWLKRKRTATDKRMGFDAPARPAGHDESGQ